MTALVVAAHPDDEVLGCGGTIARLTAAGVEVTVTILGEGATSRDEPGGGDPVAALRRSARDAVTALGVERLTMHGLPDNRFDSVDLLDVVKVVEQELAEVRPETVLTHHGSDLNIDHRTVHTAVMTATRPVPGEGVLDVYAFETLSSTEWSFNRFEPGFRPNTFVVLDEDALAAKIAALSCYDTELRTFPHPRSVDAVRVSAMRWGTVVGHPLAEALELVRSTRPLDRLAVGGPAGRPF